MNFLFLTPLAPRTRVPLFGGGGGVSGGGVKTSFRILGAVCSPRRRLLDQAQVCTYPPFLGSFAYNTPWYGTGCQTPCKFIILGEKMIPQ